MVAVNVLDEIDDPAVQCLDDELDMSRSRNRLNHLLQCAGTMSILRNLHHLGGSVLNQHGALIVGTILEKLLAQVITKRIRHEIDDVLVRLVPNHMDLLRRSVL